MAPYTLWLDLCGLSLRDAAAYHGVRLDTVKSWSAGRNRVRPEIIAELRTLRQKIEDAAAIGLDEWRRAPAASVELGIASDDHEAQALGWPCVGAQRASLALIVAALPPEVDVRVVPRGLTPATAAAADAHGR